MGATTSTRGGDGVLSLIPVNLVHWSQTNCPIHSPKILEISLDVNRFLLLFPICHQSEISHQSLLGLLHPLSISHRTWSHISVDFVTGLPACDGNTTIRSILDRF